ncbi:uncharacterized protein LOC126926638 isoform X3 [Bombus affinis]|uniref:uncharacterized protein LOC126926638 isoform X3 n=1 Tax=Bombus affinis TaxID=309941 RepID=UPI0021B7F637|nr:uncharacterized protein LOC126926638 isoform X3 [Bombus affinis]
MKQFFTRHWGSCSPIIILAVAVVWSYFIFFRTFFFGTRVSASLKRTEPLQELKNVRAMMHRCPDVLSLDDREGGKSLVVAPFYSSLPGLFGS